MTNVAQNHSPSVILTDNTVIPQVGVGVYKVPPEETYRVVTEALEIGYRHIDTASLYGNEKEVGAAIRDSGVPRKDIYLTTKLWNTDHGRQEAREAFSRSLDRLGLDYVDLYLIHWPQPAVDKYVETWETLIELRSGPELASIGVSNFTEEALTRVIRETGVIPTLNQIELHPRFSQPEMRTVHRSLGVRTSAWSPLGRGASLTIPELRRIGHNYGKTPAQVAIRWHLQLHNVVVPKSTHAQRLRENFDVYDFELTPAEMDVISGLNRPNGRLSKNPQDFNGDL